MTNPDHLTDEEKFNHANTALDNGIKLLRTALRSADTDDTPHSQAMVLFAAELWKNDQAATIGALTCAMYRLATAECRHDMDYCDAVHNITTSWTCTPACGCRKLEP